jgi:predicted dehydrogenase
MQRDAQREPRRRAVVIGLGHAAALTLAALAEQPAIEVLAGVDPLGPAAVAPLPEGAVALSSLDRLPEADIAVVATPTPTHVEVCTEVLDRCPSISLLLCEKPVALAAAEVEGLLENARQRNVEFRALLHYAFAPEVTWLAARLTGLGEIDSVDCRFEDPYGDELVERTATLTSSWVDSGINALSVLTRLVRLEDVAACVPHGRGEAETTVRFMSGGMPGSGVVRTSWLVDRARKTTRLVLGDGSAVQLDHLVGAVTAGGRLLYRSSADEPQLERYRRMWAAHLEDDVTVPGPDEVVHLHRLLERGSA